MSVTLFDAINIGALHLNNRIFMAPLTRMRATQPGHHARGPVEVLALALQPPGVRRMVGHVAQIGDLVGQLDQLRAMAQVRRVIDLALLAIVVAVVLVAAERPRLPVRAYRGRPLPHPCLKATGIPRRWPCRRPIAQCHQAALPTAHAWQMPRAWPPDCNYASPKIGDIR